MTGLPTTWATDGKLIATPDLPCGPTGAGFVNSTATAGAASTLTDSAKSWPVNGWTNYQVRIVSGTGAGQIRTISSNTATVLTVSSAWTVNPDATSVYRIEGNSDYLYLLGNGSVNMYRYSRSTNTWSMLSPVSARSAAPGAGLTACWIDGVEDTRWSGETYPTHSGAMLCQNGRYIYSFRGGASNALDIYDIAANTWISNLAYGAQNETFTTGSSAVDLGGFIYIQKDATGRIYKFDIAKNYLASFTYNPVPQGAAVVGDKMFMTTYKEGASKVLYLYTLGNTRSELTRWVVI